MYFGLTVVSVSMGLEWFLLHPLSDKNEVGMKLQRELLIYRFQDSKHRVRFSVLPSERPKAQYTVTV